jgi:hypothetical protein
MADVSSTPQPLQTILRDLMSFVQKLTIKNSDTNSAPMLPSPSSSVPSEQDGALGWMERALKLQPHVHKTEAAMRQAVDVYAEDNDFLALAKRLIHVDLSWLRRGGLSDGGAETAAAPQAETPLGSTAVSEADRASLRNTLLFLAESICPWDYDRKKPALTFVNVWSDVEAIKSDRNTYKVKVASTINPLAREWKVTARTRLASLGRDELGDGCVFAKAGVYLVGDKEPFVGVEADRTLSIPFIPGTSLYANANFKSSRKPHTYPILASAGVQQTVDWGNGLALTMRAGFNTRDGMGKLSVTPVPFASYW